MGKIKGDRALARCLADDAEDDGIEILCVSGYRIETIPRAIGQQANYIRPAESSSIRIDSSLAAVPGIGLFRRANSLTAHPTTQGLSMRGIGANAAGRVLVTLDGVPLNDPFGGWVYWSGLDSKSIDHIALLKGGNAGAYGAQALAGSVSLVSEIPQPKWRRDGSNRSFKDSSYGYANLNYGSYDSRMFEAGLSHVQKGSSAKTSVSAGSFETDGAYLLAEDELGSIDVRAASESQFINYRGIYFVGDLVRVFPTLRWYREKRTNGLSMATSETEAIDASIRLLNNHHTEYSWEVTAYYRTRDFANAFVSARDDRTTERPVLDQFDVPAWGAGVLARVQFGGLEFGLDGRRMSGETNERFRNLGAGFTRQRRAGGDQWILGLYSEYGGKADKTSYSATFRMDRWRTYGGERVETNIADGSIVRDDDVPNRGDWIWSGRLGLEHEITGAIDMRLAAYKSWRLPTLNEYYRPFRVVNDITEANANLVPEKLYGLEFGFDYAPLNTARFGATIFRNWLSDGVGNVTIGFGPGFFPLGGFVPSGGVLRQRANIDQSITDGLELEADFELQTGWSLTARYLYARARVTKFAARPELVGKRPVQTPRHGITLGTRYEGDSYTFHSELRYSSDQFDDDLNQRKLEGIVTVNAGAAYELADNVNLTANVENLFDAKVISALSATDLETLAQRRFARIGLEVSF